MHASPYDFDNDVVRKFENLFYSDDTYGGCVNESYPEIIVATATTTSTTLLCARWAEQRTG